MLNIIYISFIIFIACLCWNGYAVINNKIDHWGYTAVLAFLITILCVIEILRKELS